ncbi:MAG: hypothetical protein JO011_07655, partial [Ktedonobacteraceae bacterium]|nr:hypothetical protein [Ktedonobacteraceae bacterium]
RYQSTQELADAFRAALAAPVALPPTDVSSPYRNVQREPRGDEPLTASRPFLPPGERPAARRFMRTRRRLRGSNPQKKLILSEASSVEQTVVAGRSKRAPITPPIGEVPPLPLRPMEPEVQEPISRPASGEQPALSPERRPRLNRLATIIIAAGLALFIVLPMAYMYYIYRTHGGSTITTAASIANPTRAATATQQSGQAQQNIPHDPTSEAMATQSAVLNSQPVLVDNLSGNTLNRWTVDRSHCTFGNGGYSVNDMQTNYVQSCPMLSPAVSNSAVEVDVSMLGGTSAGILFRFNGEQYYDFEITNSNKFFFARHDAVSSPGPTSYLIKETYSNVILAMGQKNTLLMIANGADFKLYINGSFVGEAQDGTYGSGQLAFASGTSGLVTSAQASFSNLKLFKVR